METFQKLPLLTDKQTNKVRSGGDFSKAPAANRQTDKQGQVWWRLFKSSCCFFHLKHLTDHATLMRVTLSMTTTHHTPYMCHYPSFNMIERHYPLPTHLEVQKVVVRHEDNVSLRLQVSSQIIGTHPGGRKHLDKDHPPFINACCLKHHHKLHIHTLTPPTSTNPAPITRTFKLPPTHPSHYIYPQQPRPLPYLCLPPSSTRSSMSITGLSTALSLFTGRGRGRHCD